MNSYQVVPMQTLQPRSPSQSWTSRVRSQSLPEHQQQHDEEELFGLAPSGPTCANRHQQDHQIHRHCRTVSEHTVPVSPTRQIPSSTQHILGLLELTEVVDDRRKNDYDDQEEEQHEQDIPLVTLSSIEASSAIPNTMATINVLPILDSSEVGPLLTFNNDTNHHRHQISCGNDEEQAADAESEFLSAVRFCISIGKAAFRYGSPGSKVEAFLQRLMEDRFGYYRGLFRATQSELLCSVCQGEDDVPRTFLVDLEPGLNLHKLGLLADLVDQVVEGIGRHTPNSATTDIATSMDATEETARRITNDSNAANGASSSQNNTNLEAGLPPRPPVIWVTRREALARMKEIERAPDPWGKHLVFASFPIVGAGLSMLLQGTWWDCAIGGILGAVCYAVTEYLPRLNPQRFAPWVPLISALVVSTLATLIKETVLPYLHVTLVTLSAIAILLPGYTVSMGIGELVNNRVIRGAANLINGMVIMLWLVLGAWIGDALGKAMLPKDDTADTAADDDDASSSHVDAVPAIWQLLFVPLLCFSLVAVFQVSRRDTLWCFVNLHLTYLTFFVSGLLMEWTSNNDGANNESTSSSNLVAAFGGRNFQTYISSVVSCVAANAWAIRTNRPNSILLVPALILLVSGSIGFQGLLTILLEVDEDDKSVGTSQFLQMIIVALLIVAGLLTGNTLLEPSTTL